MVSLGKTAEVRREVAHLGVSTISLLALNVCQGEHCLGYHWSRLMLELSGLKGQIVCFLLLLLFLVS